MRAHTCPNIGRDIAARDSQSILSDSERLQASLLPQHHARPRQPAPRPQLADERVVGRAESRRCREKKPKLQGLCPRSFQRQTQRPQRDSLQWSELDRRQYTTRLCNIFLCNRTRLGQDPSHLTVHKTLVTSPTLISAVAKALPKCCEIWLFCRLWLWRWLHGWLARRILFLLRSRPTAPTSVFLALLSA